MKRINKLGTFFGEELCVLSDLETPEWWDKQFQEYFKNEKKRAIEDYEEKKIHKFLDI